MVLPEPYFSLSDSRDTSCAIRFFSEPVPQLRDSWDNTWCYRKPRRYRSFRCISNTTARDLHYSAAVTSISIPNMLNIITPRGSHLLMQTVTRFHLRYSSLTPKVYVYIYNAGWALNVWSIRSTISPRRVNCNTNGALVEGFMVVCLPPFLSRD